MRILLILLVMVNALNATQILAVLEIIPKEEIEGISISEMQHLTDELRKNAIQILPQKEYSVLTRDNMIELLPPDEKEADCLAESCAIEIGRAIGVEYVTQGAIGKFSDEYSLSIELYGTMSGKLLGSIVMESADIKGLLAAIREQSPGLFEKIKPLSEPEIQNVQTVQDTLIKDTIPLVPNPQPLIPESPKPETKISPWIAIALDVVGVGLITYGIVKNFEAKKNYDKYSALKDKSSPTEFDKAWKKVEDGKSARNISYIIGATSITLGIGVHIWF